MTPEGGRPDRGGDAEALLAGFDEAPLEVRIEMLSALDARLRAGLDAPELL
ncbi:hypothetical protein [Actinomyces culturomici]|uniref:hypothetical protein n=1 Tax=Actinomyces culturomici TaxID=1926276 RepID=UPI001C55357D|nr:hypothetical protein [Actinomyces culturomici]